MFRRMTPKESQVIAHSGALTDILWAIKDSGYIPVKTAALLSLGNLLIDVSEMWEAFDSNQLFSLILGMLGSINFENASSDEIELIKSIFFIISLTVKKLEPANSSLDEKAEAKNTEKRGQIAEQLFPYYSLMCKLLKINDNMLSGDVICCLSFLFQFFNADQIKDPFLKLQALQLMMKASTCIDSDVTYSYVGLILIDMLISEDKDVEMAAICNGAFDFFLANIQRDQYRLKRICAIGLEDCVIVLMSMKMDEKEEVEKASLSESQIKMDVEESSSDFKNEQKDESLQFEANAEAELKKHICFDCISTLTSELRKLAFAETFPASARLPSSNSSSSGQHGLPRSISTTQTIHELCTLLCVLVEASIIPLSVFINAHVAALLTEGLYIPNSKFQIRLLKIILMMLKAGNEDAAQWLLKQKRLHQRHLSSVLNVTQKMREELKGEIAKSDGDSLNAIESKMEIETSEKLQSEFVRVVFLILENFSYFWKEEFDNSWEDRWVIPEHNDRKKKGEWTYDIPRKCHQKEKCKGLKTTTDGGYHKISADVGKTISSYNSTFIFSYTVKNEQSGYIGGSYVKLLPDKLNQTAFSGSSPYYIMFGQDQDKTHPDMVQLIIRKGKKEYHHREPISLKHDARTHMFAIVIYPDLGYEVLIDDFVVREGKMYDDFPDAFEPEFIPDPNATKPQDWCDLPEIPDPRAEKPKNWDQPLVLPVPNAKKPDDWDDEKDGEWEPPVVPNPAYKGTWMPPIIKNPAYKGEWSPPPIKNPNWENSLIKSAFKRVRYVGIEVYQPTAGSIFDNFFVGDDLPAYRAFVHEIWDPIKRYEDVYEPEQAHLDTIRSAEKPKEKEKTKKKSKKSEDDEYDFTLEL
ncbi:putative calreticulin [Monocercomonoides exilis]|uniref:putative calreticulin n=1 Tax=Monocercomonoides exilis TaxID=2049356 RepID=UPI00355A0660|nr:putative calreticulin [Monocercomonoides exilis]|eukprot:MONOS_10032.1-p1 / transcript=MONOS_10032.1 / gene=MONOS_10032 / organism=Monocercomonoides_exilis_PA203 / gene_product=calreticulin / transcript_product=calreticulin / location=Mono_scaffold00438:25427-28997(+) / protein_length=862 / sequence_SO=supercontig / SO=protein_coding / is_pseudo=false